jgi:hypothetical protein
MKTRSKYGNTTFMDSLILGGVLLTGSQSFASTVVVPPDRGNQSGNNEWVAGFLGSSAGGQTVYGAKNFSTPVVITGMAFRADENHDQTSPSFNITIPRFTIRFTTWSGSRSSFSGFYADNKGADDTQVFDGSVHWTGFNAIGTAPNPFDMQVTFTTPFVYDPSRGSLLMEFDSAGPTSTSLRTSVDYHGHGDPATGFTYIGGGLEIANIVTQFTFVSIPEPSPFAILGVFGIIISLSYRKTQSPSVNSLILGGVLLTGSQSFASTVVVPADRENQSGNGEWVAGFANPTTGAQTVYGAKNFSTPVMITGVAFRSNEEDLFTGSFDVTIPRFSMRLTTWSGSLNSFSRFYDVNKGPDDMQVFDGSVHWSGFNAIGNAPNAFDFQLIFTTPFVYDPSRGSLLMEFDSTGPTSTSLKIGADYHSHPDPAFGFTYIGGGLESANMITQFAFVSIPEPSTVAVLAIFGVIVGLLSRKAK